MKRSSEATLMSAPSSSAVIELLKPITWFPPMWAFGCGVVSAGLPLGDRWPLVVLGILLTGPLVCGTSQAVNDWYDRHVDAINEPNRPIPSGRIPGEWGFYISVFWTALSLAIASLLGAEVLVAAALGLALAWAYSAPPLRLKRNGWWGNAAVGACYEGLPWLTGAAVMAGALPNWRVFVVAALYSKSIEGDKSCGVRSLPVQLGADRAAQLACLTMAVPQAVVVVLLWFWDCPVQAAVVLTSLAAQGVLMTKLLKDPRAHAPWYNATGVTLYVTGMLVTAFALRAFCGGS
jgi:chlorophyll/bacteriochlorophyll a synthase